MKPSWYGCLARRRKYCSHEVSGQSKLIVMLTTAIAMATKCAHITRGQRHARNPPNGRNNRNATCAAHMRSASTVHIAATPSAPLASAAARGNERDLDL